MIPKPSKYLEGTMSKKEQIVSHTKRCAHVISGFKQLLSKVTYDGVFLGMVIGFGVL